MHLSRREFLNTLAVGSAAGMGLFAQGTGHAGPMAQPSLSGLYDLPVKGNVSLLHFTDVHAQLMPVYFREPSVNLGVADMANRAPHLVGANLLNAFGFKPHTPLAHAYTSMDFSKAAQLYGKVGGFAHLATLVKRLRAQRPGALLLDGGDTWQGSAVSLWTRGQDMVDACKLLGVDVMTLHWECTYGQDRVLEIAQKDFAGKIDIIAQNIQTQDFGDEVFPAYVIRSINGVQVAIIGQAFPYTPIANPRYMVSDWSFGIRDDQMQKRVDEVRTKGAQVVVLLSHNGMDVDLKMASRVSGIDVILGGHTHDGVPAPIPVKNAGGVTQVTNAGSNGKFLGVLDMQVTAGKLQSVSYRLLPVFSNALPADPDMQALIDRSRAPYLKTLTQPLGVSDGLLYRRGNFNGTWDQLIVDGLMAVKGADIAFSPGFRWGTTVLPGQTLTREHLMDQTAITYPWTTLTEMTGADIKNILEDVCDNLFNPDPYYQQGGDMVRVGGMSYACAPLEKMGKRIQDMRLKGAPIEADKKYKVAGWAPVAEAARDAGGVPIWDVMEQYLKDRKTVSVAAPNAPRLIGVSGNKGLM